MPDEAIDYSEIPDLADNDEFWAKGTLICYGDGPLEEDGDHQAVSFDHKRCP